MVGRMVTMAAGRSTQLLVLVAAGLLLSPCVSEGAGYWLPPLLVGENDDYDSSCACIGVAADGSVVVVWSAIDPAQYDSEIADVVIKDGVQSEQATVHEPNGDMDRVPFMSVGNDGVPWIVWERYGDGYEQTVSHFTGAGWSTPEVVMDGGGRYDAYNIYSANSQDVWVTCPQC
jgi:hypothetical protein